MRQLNSSMVIKPAMKPEGFLVDDASRPAPDHVQKWPARLALRETNFEDSGDNFPLPRPKTLARPAGGGKRTEREGWSGYYARRRRSGGRAEGGAEDRDDEERGQAENRGR
ncbi:hypothetical protein KM043_008626 [Ampulex compressa]|nr:hypothetical protein KM043_008626 [Ampulex compressa]